MQVFVALLRTTEQDGKKPLVRQALDVLAPALPKRLPPPGPHERFPIWVRYTKKVTIRSRHAWQPSMAERLGMLRRGVGFRVQSRVWGCRV